MVFNTFSDSAFGTGAVPALEIDVATWNQNQSAAWDLIWIAKSWWVDHSELHICPTYIIPIVQISPLYWQSAGISVHPFNQLKKHLKLDDISADQPQEQHVNIQPSLGFQTPSGIL